MLTLEEEAIKHADECNHFEAWFEGLKIIFCLELVK